MSKYQVVCSKEKEFLKDGCTMNQIYGEIPYRNLLKRVAKLSALQLNEWPVDNEIYTVIKEE